jgi:acyl-CoA synthetase (AMP-forming)/AMP-acid ligase II
LRHPPSPPAKPNLGNYADFITAHAQACPHKRALVDATTTLTYGELDPLITRNALALRHLGVVSGEIVGVSLPDTAAHCVMLLAVARLGAIILPMDHRWTTEEAARIAAQFAIQRMLVAPGREALAGVQTIKLDASWDSLVAAQPKTAAEFPHDDTMPMLLSMSSGTTGTPKGPLSTHAAQITRILNGAITRDDIVLTATPLYFGGGRNFSIGSLLRGATIILFPPPFHPEKLVAKIAAEKVTYTFLVPTQMRRLLQLPDDGTLLFPSLRLLVSSGAVLYPDERSEIMRRLSPNLINLYSSTEGGSVATLRPEDQGERAKSVGRVHRDVTVQIVDADDRVLPNGEVGRIRQKSPVVPDGFYNNPEETKKHFRDGWYYPGDLGHLDDDGFLYLAGRSKEMIIRGGINIYPGEIEEPLLRLPEIHDCAAVAWPSAELGEELALFVVRAGDISEADVLAHCRAVLSPYKVPKGVFFIEELPKNAHGKVTRAALASRLPPQGAP